MNHPLFYLYSGISGSLLFACFVGAVLFKRFHAWNRIERWMVSLIPLALLTVLFHFAYKVYAAIFNDHSWIRFEKTWSLALGYPLYYGLDSGPALVTIYGPVSVLFYLPATLVRDPLTSIRIAQALAILIFYLPIFWIHVKGNRQDQKLFSFSILTFIFFCFASLALTSTRQGAFIVHADAPTLGLGALSCGFILFRKRPDSWGFLFLSALCSVLAIWSKQVAAPIIPAIALYLFMIDGWPVVRRYLLCAVLAGTLVSGIFLFCFDARNMFFQMFVIPSRHPIEWKGGINLPTAFFRIFREWLVMALWASFSMAPLFFSKSKPQPMRNWLRTNPWALLLFVGLMMITISIQQTRERS